MTPTQRSLAQLRADGYTCQVVERLERHISSTEDDGCWHWIGAHDSTGYGRCSKKTAGLGEQWAHRLVYRLLVGAIPDGFQLDHLCRVRDCVNPSHLEPVTHAENARRSPLMGAAYKARSAATHCVHGHPRTPDNLYIDKRGYTACLTCRRIRSRR